MSADEVLDLAVRLAGRPLFFDEARADEDEHWLIIADERLRHALTPRQERVLALMATQLGVWRTPRELGARGSTLPSLHKRGIVERHTIGPGWYAYRLPGLDRPLHAE